ncbi:fibrous sheath CABYR-binding protein-like isoform X2 [Channa argus]|uniref:fibrous sheath CABYR-binding protein-like isoform X2 n=1 Tax=Channa argus TaxID=215402 RepID=UPI00351FF2A6
MGCSSSSAQTVDQEKRPGTKPEDSNGDTVVRNGIIAEDAQTIEDQMQLPVQTALPDDLQLGIDNEAGAVLVAQEAKEDLFSVEDLLAAPEKPAPEAPFAATEEVFTEPEAALVAVEALSPVGEVSPVETEVNALVEATGEGPDVKNVAAVQGEAPVVVEVTPLEPAVTEQAKAAVVVEEEANLETEVNALVEATGEGPDVKNVAAVQGEAPVVVEVTPLEPAVTEQAKAAMVVEEEANLGADVPAESAAPMEAEIASTPAESREQSEISEQASNQAAAPNLGPHDASASSEYFAPAEAEIAVIDAKIAEATLPEMPPLIPVTVEAQAESQPDVKDVLEPPVAPAETSPSEEAPCSTETTLTPAPEAESAAGDDAAAVAQVVEATASTPAVSETPAEVIPEASPADTTSESILDNTAPADATPATSESISAPDPAADPAHELLPEVLSVEEASQETESEKTRNED